MTPATHAPVPGLRPPRRRAEGWLELHALPASLDATAVRRVRKLAIEQLAPVRMQIARVVVRLDSADASLPSRCCIVVELRPAGGLAVEDVGAGFEQAARRALGRVEALVRMAQARFGNELPSHACGWIR